ncbi:MAG: SpoVG family protein [Candidatus Omnitrophota bacterium]|nr:SpoVG family protein [Candidatus Omnitrophota bacterium]
MVEASDIQVARLFRVEKEGSKLKAFVDLAIGGCLIVKGFKIMQGQEGLFVSMPSQPGKDGKWYQVALPATKEKGQEISEIILSAYRE